MNNKDIKIIFFGTDDFVIPVLETLKTHFDVVESITKPLTSKELTTYILKLTADLAVVASYGKIISQSVINHFNGHILNVHPSLLPKYRGMSPVRTALLNGDTQTGVTIIELDNQIDHGPILAQKKVEILDDERSPELHKRLFEIGADLLIEVIPKYITDNIDKIAQDDSKAIFTKKITRNDGLIDWNDSHKNIYNKFRAYYPWPGIFMNHELKNKNRKLRVKILDCELVNEKLVIKILQPEGKKPMDLKSFINGYGTIAQFN